MARLQTSPSPLPPDGGPDMPCSSQRCFLLSSGEESGCALSRIVARVSGACGRVAQTGKRCARCPSLAGPAVLRAGCRTPDATAVAHGGFRNNPDAADAAAALVRMHPHPPGSARGGTGGTNRSHNPPPCTQWKQSERSTVGGWPRSRKKRRAPPHERARLPPPVSCRLHVPPLPSRRPRSLPRSRGRHAGLPAALRLLPGRIRWNTITETIEWAIDVWSSRALEGQKS